MIKCPECKNEFDRQVFEDNNFCCPICLSSSEIETLKKIDSKIIRITKKIIKKVKSNC